MKTKICTKCGLEKQLYEFPKEKDKPRNPCKECQKEYLKTYYSNNKHKAKEHNKQYYLQNKEKLLSSNKQYRLKNKDKIKEQRKIYREANTNVIKENKKLYYQKNKEEILNKRKEYYKGNKEKIIEKNTKYYEKNKDVLMNKAKIRNTKRKMEDPIYRLKCQIRNMIRDSFKRKKKLKDETNEKILGCSIIFFQNYLLETYKNNYGVEWDKIQSVHIDHIIPLSTVDTKDDIIKLCHYTNLQLLKDKDNLKKSNKLIWELKK